MKADQAQGHFLLSSAAEGEGKPNRRDLLLPASLTVFWNTWKLGLEWLQALGSFLTIFPKQNKQKTITFHKKSSNSTSIHVVQPKRP